MSKKRVKKKSVSGRVKKKPEPLSADRATHRDFVFERRKNIDKLISKIKSDRKLKEKFFADPESVGKKFSVNFTHEEIQGLRLLDGVPLDNLRERLVFSPVGIFDSNCGCGGGGSGSSSW